VPPARVRLTASKSSLGRHSNLRLARPPGSDSTSTQKTVSASPDPRARTQPRLRRRSPPRPTLGLGLNLDPGRRSPPRPTPGLRLNLDSEDGLRLARPPGSDSTSTRKTVSASPDPRARTQPRPPDDGLRLARPPGSNSTSTSKESPPHSGRPHHKGGHHYPTPS
jgi:hypothetical protein